MFPNVEVVKVIWVEATGVDLVMGGKVGAVDMAESVVPWVWVLNNDGFQPRALPLGVRGHLPSGYVVSTL